MALRHLILPALLVYLACISAALGQEDWPRWRGPRGDGTWQSPKLPKQWPKSGLKRHWRQSIGGGYAGVVVSQGRVYTMDRQTEPKEVERTICFAADSGKPLWTHQYQTEYGDLQYGNGPRSTPTVFDGKVYTFGSMGHAHCLDAATGKVVWSKNLVTDRKRVPTWGLAASPVIFKHLVILHPGIEPKGCYVALERDSGREVWRSLADAAGYATPILIESPSGPQLICWTATHVRALRPDTGTLLWSVPFKLTYATAIATPIYRDNIVFVSGYWEGSKAIRLGKESGEAEVIWEDNRNLRGLMSQPLYRDKHAYLLDKRHGLTCFELAKGTKVWDDKNQMTPRGRNPQATMVWLSEEGRVIVLNSDGQLILARLTPEEYQEQSRTKIIGSTWAHPAYHGNRVYARSDSELICVSLVEPAPSP